MWLLQAVLMSARNTIVMEVLMHNGSGELMVKALGEGARDWFKDAPWHVGEGCFLRDLIDVDDGKVVDQLHEAISKGTSLGAATPMQVSLRLAHFSKTKYLLEGMQAGSKQAAFEHDCSIELVEYVASRVEVHLLPADTKAPSKESSSLRPMRNQNGSRALLYFFPPSTWECIARKQEDPAVGDQVGMEDAAGASEAAHAHGSWRCSEEQVDPELATKAKTIEELIGSAHEYMGVFKLNYVKSWGLSAMCDDLWSGHKSGLEQLMSGLTDPFAVLDERDKDVMERYLSSLETPSDIISPSKARTQHVGECIELHSGIRASPEGDFLTLLYRLALPRDVGGYESAWKLLYTYKLNKKQAVGALSCNPARALEAPACVQSAVCHAKLPACSHPPRTARMHFNAHAAEMPDEEAGKQDLKVEPGMSLKLLPRLVRGQKSQMGVVILALNTEERAEGGSVKLLQQMHLSKNAKSQDVSLEGHMCFSESKLCRSPKGASSLLRARICSYFAAVCQVAQRSELTIIVVCVCVCVRSCPRADSNCVLTKWSKATRC
jgi:hypothetical protein